MKPINKITQCFTIALLFVATFAAAQDTRFSQPLNNQLALNPAMMALTSDFRISLSYRNQWASIEKGYVNYAGSLLYPLFLKTGGSAKDTTRKAEGKSRIDFGLNLNDDKAGGFNLLNATLSVGYSLQLSPEHSLSAALNLGYLHRSFNVLQQSWDEQYSQGSFDVNAPTGETPSLKKGSIDVGLGLMYHYVQDKGKWQAFAGLGAFHVNQPNLTVLLEDGSLGKLATRFNIQAGVKMIGNKIDFTPVMLYNIQGRYKQFTGGMLLAYKFGEKGKLVVGSWYKEKQSVVLQAGYEHKLFFFTYSYDFGISKLDRTTKGLMTHEVTLAFKLVDVAKKKGIKNNSFF